MSDTGKKEIIEVLDLYLRENNHHIPQSELRVQFLGHPGSGSFRALTDALDHLKVPNVAAEVNADDTTLGLLPQSFFAWVSDGGRNGMVLAKRVKDEVLVYKSVDEQVRYSISAFLDMWTGLVVLVEKGIKTKLDLFRGNALVSGLIALLAVVSGVALYRSVTDWYQLGHLFLSLGGLAIFGLIYRSEMGLNSALISKICGEGEKTSCEDVLASQGASIFRWLKLTDLGIIYFGSLLSFWVLKGLGSDFEVSMVYTGSLLVLPITVYSIIYQAFRIKKWCRLCLVSVLILWAQAGVVLASGTDVLSFSWVTSDLLGESLSVLTVISAWVILKKAISSSQSLQNLQVDYFKLRRDFELFKPAYLNQPKLSYAVDYTSELVLGNQDKDCALKIVAITNPSCFYCKEQHQQLVSLLSGPSEVQVVVRFSVNYQNHEEEATLIAQKLMEIYHKADSKTFMRAWHEAYSNMPQEDWISTWGQSDDGEILLGLEAHRKWCSEQGLNFTPVTLINGREFPKQFGLEDLAYFTEDLTELTG
ncbi:MAG: hypothetical protein HEP71_21975 [Roseivirga sp.]|nr:hypothetical protein [Roseivirga sp.]